MNYNEAEKIVAVVLKTNYPWSYYALRSIFIDKIPESFLPYSKEKILSAITILMTDKKNDKIQRALRGLFKSMFFYSNNEEALDRLKDNLSSKKIQIIKKNILTLQKCFKNYKIK
ncbi:MAG: hypothetical protein WC164_01950 [Patescibacteria group bacterium]|jgi:hypothetical protein|nr:hypothetical protein [bacterium]